MGEDLTHRVEILKDLGKPLHGPLFVNRLDIH